MRKDHQQNDGIYSNYQEADMLKFPLEDRLVASAQRLLDEKPPKINDNRLLHPLRSYQLPVFHNFSIFLMVCKVHFMERIYNLTI